MITLSKLFKSIFYLPSCIFFKDTKLRYKFSTKKWEQLHGDMDIYNKTDLEIRKDYENALYAYNKDKEILETGKGTSYIIKSEVDGNTEYLEIFKEPVITKRGKTIGIVGLINNVTDRVLLNQKIEELSNTDWLTGVLNRKAGTYTIKASLRDSDNGMFCLLDIDHFKFFNDTYGHQVGDKVLQEVAKALQDVVFKRDVIMRIGGDEFVVLLNNINPKKVNYFMEKLFNRIDEIKIPEIEENKIAISIGVTEIKPDSTFDILYTTADKNMYKAKEREGNYYIYSGGRGE